MSDATEQPAPSTHKTVRQPEAERPYAVDPTAERPRALDAIALHAQTVRDPAALYPVVGAALKELGLLCHIDEWDAATGEVVICYSSLGPALSRAARTLLGRSIEGLRLPVAPVPSLVTAIESGRAVYLANPEDDIAAAVPWLPRTVTRRLMHLIGVEKVIVAPLLSRGTAIGVLVVLGQTLSQGDLPLMASLGAHVGESLVAVRSLHSARRREVAALALGDLSVRVAAGVGAEELPALAVRALRAPLGAAAAAVWLLDEGPPAEEREPVLRLAAHEGVPAHSMPSMDMIPLSADRLTARVAREGQSQSIWGQEPSSEYRETRAVLAGAGFGLAITAPLKAAERVLGALSLTFTETRPASPDERAFVDTVSAQVAAALENARLLDEARAQATRSALLAEVAALLSSSLDPATLVTALVRRTAEALHGCAGLYRAREVGDDLDVMAIHHPDPAKLAQVRQGLLEVPPRAGVGVFGRVYAEGSPQLVRFDEPDLPESQRIYAERVGAVSSIGVPLTVRGRSLGVLSVSSFQGERAYDQEDLTLATAIATLAAQALDNAQAYALAEQDRRRLAATFESMVDAVVLYDAEGRVIDLNAAGVRLFGLPARDEGIRPAAEYLALLDMRHPDGRPMTTEETASSRAVRGELVVGFEEVVRDVFTGEDHYLIANAAPLYDERDEISGAVLVAHDVTALRTAERAKDEFLSVASHELKTPLTPLKGFIQIMETILARAEEGAPLNQARLRRYLRLMHGRVDRLADLVGEMIDFSRLQAGRFALSPAPVDLATLAAEVLAGFEGQAEMYGSERYTFVLDAPTPVLVECDHNRIEQVLSNLLANAVKYSPRGGYVYLRVRRQDDHALVVVEDEGIGIPHGEEETLFQPFARASNAPTLQYGGVGLGLFICKEIVERHGGAIKAMPRDPTGKRPGASFRVTLPL